MRGLAYRISLFLTAGSTAVLAAAPEGRLEAPVQAILGGRVPVRLSFRSESGELLSQVVSFQLSVTGSARFIGPPRQGKLLDGDGKPTAVAETEGGVFEIDLETPSKESLRFAFTETSGLGVGLVRQIIFRDSLDGGRPLWYGRTLRGPVAAWTLVEAPGESDLPREGVRAWWSGPWEPSKDSALISRPLRIPLAGKTFLRFLHRYGFEGSECLSPGKAHHGARLEAETAAGTWVPVAPEGSYPLTVESSCPGGLQGQTAFGGASGDRFALASFDLGILAGKQGRVRLRLAAGCETCGPQIGWLIDDIALETTDLGLKVFDPDEDDDRDGVPNGVEIIRGSDLESSDTDGDGLLDSVEDLTGIFSGSGSTGTDPSSPDSDGGGIPDGSEVSLGMDPNDPGSEPARKAMDLSFPAGAGYRWALRGDGTAGQSSGDPLTELFTGRGGLRLVVENVPFPSLGEAFHGGSGEGTFCLGPERVGPFIVTRTFSISSGTGAIACLETFENFTFSPGIPQPKTIILDCEFAQKSWVEVEAASRGAGEWGTGDDYVLFNDRDPFDGMPSFLWLYSNDGAAQEPSSATLGSGVGRLGFALTVKPGERKSILHFGAQSADLAAGQAMAQRLLDGGPQAGIGIFLRDEREIVNLILDRDGDGLPGNYELAHGLDPLDPSDGSLDSDGDGLSILEEFRLGTDPGSRDTDGDGLDDGKEVKELGTNPTSGDSDADGLPDGSDPFPTVAIAIRFSGDRYALSGEAGTAEVRTMAGGKPFELPLRFTLILEGAGAVFAEPVEGGTVLSGIGTSRALVEVRGGLLKISVLSSIPGRKVLKVSDTESQGVSAEPSVLEDFEAWDGGFEAVGAKKSWKWGAPPAKPGPASGKKVWGIGFEGAYPPNAFETLTTPEYTIGDEGTPVLEFLSYLEIEENYDYAFLAISADGGEFELLGQPLPSSGGKYLKISRSLTAYLGKNVRFAFIFQSDGITEYLGWFIDDFRVAGLKESLTMDFLDGGDDPDKDGLTNRTEVERGTNPLSADTDSDGLPDGVETGTGVFVDSKDTGSRPTNPDSDGGGELDGAEVSAGRDPNTPFDDRWEVTFGPYDLGIPFDDGAGNGWFGTPVGTLYLEGSSVSFGVELNALFLSDVYFWSSGGTVTFGKQILILDEDPDFSGPPLTIERKLFVSLDRAILRWTEVFDNLGTQALRFSLSLGSALYLSSSLEVISTGSGDRMIDGEDAWFVVRFPGGAESFYLAYAIRDGASRWRPSSVQIAVGSSSIDFDLTIPARKKVSLIHFASLSKKLEDVEAALDLVRTQDPSVLGGLEDADSDAAINFQVDRDGDGLPDAYERAHGLDPRDASDAALDPDGDGLSTREEFLLGTDPRKADTDGDGLSDGEEVNAAATDPLLGDTDGDGVSDGKDPLPLHKILARKLDGVFGIAGEETRLKIHLEIAGSTAPPPANVRLDEIIFNLRFGRDVEVVRVISGEEAGPPSGNSYPFHTFGEWLVLDVRSAAEGTVEMAIDDPAGAGIVGSPSTLHFLPPDGDPDGDKLPSRFEVERGTNPLAPDTDGDGISDRLETGSLAMAPGLEIGSFPWSDDSDGGGTRDAEEVLDGRNPLDPRDDLKLLPLPLLLEGGAGKWSALNSWVVTGAAIGSQEIDNACALRVNGHPLPPVDRAWAAGRSTGAILGPVTVEGLEVSRHIYAHPSVRFLRFMEVVSNPGTSPAIVILELRLDFSGDFQVALDTTSSGDGVYDARDQWALFTDRGKSVLRVFHGPESGKKIEILAGDLTSETFSFEVPPGETRTVIHSIARGLPRADLILLAQSLLDLGGGALDGLLPADILNSANLPRPPPILWDLYPHAAVAPGEPWWLAGEFLRPDLKVLVGGEPVEALMVFPGRMVLRAPASVGEKTVEVLSAEGKPLPFSEVLRVENPGGRFDRGDVDENREVDLTDAIRILAYLFLKGTVPRCLDSADTDDSGEVDLTDVVFLLGAIFEGKGPFPYPGGTVPGPDPTPDPLDCR